MSHLPVDPLFDNSEPTTTQEGLWIRSIKDGLGAYAIFVVIVCVCGLVGAIFGSVMDVASKHTPHVKIEIGEKSYETPEH